MRKELCEAMLKQASDPSMIFLTGDLGFMALEPLQEMLKERFINAGVAEQNLISVAAAMARDEWSPWCYSIAPFIYARPFEQIRNDICLHDLPVKLIGNGGGYGYGVMGPTHHAVEDYGVLLSLPFMKVFVPCFNEDVAYVIALAAEYKHPCYIRLGRGELPDGEEYPVYESWRHVIHGNGTIVVCTGAIGGMIWTTLRSLPEHQKPDLWIVTELPLSSCDIPETLVRNLYSSAALVVIEEHIAHGGLGSMLIHRLLSDGIPVTKFCNLNSHGLATGIYGSQQYLRNNCGLSEALIRQAVLQNQENIHE